MKINATGLLRQSAECLEKRKRDDWAYAFSLREMADHIDMVRKGEVTAEEFCEAYMIQLAPPGSPLAPMPGGAGTEGVG